MSSYCLNVIYEFNYVVYFHKNALLTPHLHDLDDLPTFVAKFCRNNLRTFSSNLLGLKKTVTANLFAFWMYECHPGVVSTEIHIKTIGKDEQESRKRSAQRRGKSIKLIFSSIEENMIYCCIKQSKRRQDWKSVWARETLKEGGYMPRMPSGYLHYPEGCVCVLYTLNERNG